MGTRNLRQDEGSVTLLVAFLSVAALMLISLLSWQGTQLRAAREATHLAEEAARAGAGQLDTEGAYTSGVRRIDPDRAVRQARAYLTTMDVPGSVTVIDGRRIRVQATVTKPAPGLSIIGVSSISATGTATAELLVGVRGDQQ